MMLIEVPYAGPCEGTFLLNTDHIWVTEPSTTAPNSVTIVVNSPGNTVLVGLGFESFKKLVLGAQGSITDESIDSSADEGTQLVRLEVPAEWVPDCCGKQDYDADVVAISSRYWPGGYDPANGKQIAPSAYSSILLRHKTIYGPSEPDGKCLVGMWFSAETEEDVKAQVEAWAQEQYTKIARVLSSALHDTGDDHARL